MNMMEMTCMMYEDYRTTRLCEEYGGPLPYTLQGSEPSEDIGAEWHWRNYPPVGSTCLAIRPAWYQEGAADDQLHVLPWWCQWVLGGCETYFSTQL